MQYIDVKATEPLNMVVVVTSLLLSHVSGCAPPHNNISSALVVTGTVTPSRLIGVQRNSPTTENHYNMNMP